MAKKYLTLCKKENADTGRNGTESKTENLNSDRLYAKA
jgi:hypothetical protein